MKINLIKSIAIMSILSACAFLPHNNVQAATYTANSNNNSFSYLTNDGWWKSTGYTADRVTGRVVKGDFNGDGKDDIATFYDYGNGASRIHVFLSNGSSFNYSNQAHGWWGVSGGYDVNNVSSRVVAGDFNGDGKDDIAAMYDYGNGKTAIQVFTSTGSSFNYSGPDGWWKVDSGYDASRVTGKLVAGDFNGDGKDDIAAMYDYGNTRAAIHVFTSTGSSFNYSGPDGWWQVGSGYDASRVTGKLVAGDFNGDGKADVAAMYDYGNTRAAIHVFTSTGSSFNYSGPDGWWQVGSGYDASKVTGRVVAGDFNGDKAADIATIYDYGNSTSAIHMFTSNCPGSKGQALVNYAKQFIGVPYLWGGTTPAGFDCSGLVMYCYAHFGITLPHYTGDQVKYGTIVTGSLQPGDLLFFGSTSDPSHVAIYAGNGQMVEAPHSGTNVRVAPIRSYSIAKRIF